MNYRGRWWLLVLLLGLSCGQPTPPPLPVPPALRRVPDPPGAGDFAYGPFRAPLSIEDAEQILVRTRIFAFGGMPPKRQVQAFNLLLDQPNARARFAVIAARGNTAGQLYALCAFLALDQSPAAALSATPRLQGELMVQDSDVFLGFKSASGVASLIGARRLWEGMRAAREETADYFGRAVVSKE